MRALAVVFFLLIVNPYDLVTDHTGLLGWADDAIYLLIAIAAIRSANRSRKLREARNEAAEFARLRRMGLKTNEDDPSASGVWVLGEGRR